MVDEITFKCNAKQTNSSEKFSLRFHKLDGDWELASTDLDDIYVDAECLLSGVNSALNTLNEIDNLERKNKN